MISDIIVTWPKNCDYPLWRQFLRDNRARFNEIIVAFMNPNSGYDYSDFVRQTMHQDYVHFLEAPVPRHGIDDWRDLAVNASLLHSYNAPWVWFTEQDFYPKEGFWDEVKKHEDEGCDVIAVYQAERMHPCCIFIKREALNKTSKNFGIVPGVSDHFSIFQKELENAGVKVGKIAENTYHHYNGLSHNWRLASEGGEPNYQVDDFIDWVQQSTKVTVEKHPNFMEVASAVIIKEEAKKA